MEKAGLRYRSDCLRHYTVISSTRCSESNDRKFRLKTNFTKSDLSAWFSFTLIHFKSSTSKYIFFGDGTNRVANEYITIVQEPGDKRTAVNDGGSLSAGTWYNIVFNYESSQYNIYINNTLKSTTIGTSTGNVPLIEPNYNITVPSNPLGAAAQFALSLAGSQVPFSTIPGSYWDPNINPPQPTTLQQSLLANPIAAAGKFVSNLLGANKTGTQIFYNKLYKMNTRNLLLLFLFIGYFNGNAQNKKNILLTINSNPVYSSDFTKVFNKNLDLVVEESKKCCWIFRLVYWL